MKLETKKKQGIKTWYYDFTLRGRRQRGWLLPSSVMTKRQARDAIQKVKAKILSTLLIEAKKQGASLYKQIFHEYEEYLKTCKPNTYYGRMEHVFKHFEFFTGKDRIIPSDITKYQQLRLKQGVSGTTVNRELNFCDAAFNRAKRKRLTSNNPFTGFDKFEEQSRTRFLTEEELVRLMKAISVSDKRAPHLKGIILTAIFTGLRLRSIFELHRDEINFNLGIIVKRQEKTTRNKRPAVVPIPDGLVSTLKAKLRKNKSGYVFENPYTNKPMNNIKRSFKRALRKAGIKNFRFHDLRHTFATYALVQSRDLRGVQEILGHSSITTTEKYTHVLAREKLHIVNGVGEFVSGLLGAKHKE